MASEDETSVIKITESYYIIDQVIEKKISRSMKDFVDVWQAGLPSVPEIVAAGWSCS